jgi:DNA-binding winged helix-turn-helix (wHTH) protein
MGQAMRIRFGDFCLELETRQLTERGEPVQISPKAFQLLQFLLEKRPKALSVRELYKHVWPDTFVEKANLRNLIAEVRSVIHDPARSPRMIRTVFGFGYSFAGEAREESETPVSSCRYQLVHGATEHRIFEGENVIGREAQASVLIDSTAISRRHAVVIVDGGHVYLEDLGSKNGTFLNGSRVKSRVEVNDGAEIRLGLVKLVLRAIVSDGSTETVGDSVDG